MQKVSWNGFKIFGQQEKWWLYTTFLNSYRIFCILHFEKWIFTRITVTVPRCDHKFLLWSVNKKANGLCLIAISILTQLDNFFCLHFDKHCQNNFTLNLYFKILWVMTRLILLKIERLHKPQSCVYLICECFGTYMAH